MTRFHLFGGLGKAIFFLLEMEVVFPQSKFVSFQFMENFFRKWISFPPFIIGKSKNNFSKIVFCQTKSTPKDKKRQNRTKLTAAIWKLVNKFRQHSEAPLFLYLGENSSNDGEISSRSIEGKTIYLFSNYFSIFF